MSREIHCTGCGGVHIRPGGQYCKVLKRKTARVKMASGGLAGEGTSHPYSPGFAWSSFLSKEELDKMPLRTDPGYLDFCEKAIEDLNDKLKVSEEELKLREAEEKISGLIAKLHIPSVDAKMAAPPGERASPPAVVHRPSALSPPPGSDGVSAGLPSPLPVLSSLGGPSPPCHYVVESTDSKEYLSRLHPEAHLPTITSYESMNYRDLVLGMSGVHAHLVYWGRPTRGYESHCTFVKRKAASFLYTNMANVLYDRMVTEKVISGEYDDFPSSCGDASLQFYCDSYRNERVVGTPSPGQKPGRKPWSGYPYPFCYFWNEMSSCCKRNCSLKHECGFCHTAEHKSQSCAKSTWKKPPEKLDDRSDLGGRGEA